MIEIKSITSVSQFTEEIQHLVSSSNISYMDAIVGWCENKNVDIETAIPLVRKSQVIKAKLESEAIELNLFNKSAKLPI